MWRWKRAGQSSGAKTPDAPEWTWSTSDSALAAGLLALTVAVCVPVGYYFHSNARAMDRQVEETQGRVRMLRTTLEYVENRKTDLARLRREVNRYVADVETRPMVPWSTVVAELSRRRPDGLWTTRIWGSGPQFRAQVAAMSPDLVGQYARQLRESPYVEFAALPAGDAPATGAQVVGRMMGE
jgi:hypothetical protein